jgi:hypothetical protein
MIYILPVLQMIGVTEKELHPIHFYVLVCEDTCAPAGGVRWT